MNKCLHPVNSPVRFCGQKMSQDPHGTWACARGHRPLFQPGQRIALESTDDQHTKLRPGDEGTVRDIDDAGQIQICWDSGSHLAMIVAKGPLDIGVPGEKLDRIRGIKGEPRFCANCTLANEYLEGA